ncbi:discoidin domain-containing protein [Pectobacterium aroidearum]|uniref:discoidin domain-containing protein n=1 Tax=Pectobacterium aroidearum TaxID=1201031 RepID=UPI0015F4B39D|nr:discoidin domain-containing protein [Pectobacterium aroidearum]MBA5601063.1 discoidin domain-containing protein [Pectobacterium aroidearum]
MSDQVEIPDINDLPDMQEAAEFTPVVKLLTIETPVLGYDGTNINPANWQAKALADRTQWLRDRLLNLSTRLVLSVNGKTGNVVVTYNDVGADAAGTADALMTAHLTALDPHSQYFDETRGDTRYVQRSLANQSNGWLQLDAAGKIPAAMLQTLASRYVVVANQAARLALASSANLTICAQADIDQLFYLNGGANPAVAANWVAGQSATVSGVSSVFGRSGAVTAQNGDYDADKITETATRKFATLAEKTAWNAKQAALVSGTNIRSLFGNSLLGSGNLAPTPAQMGAAAAVHTHTTADITDYTQKTQQLITASLEAGQGVTLGYNPVSGKTIISASGGSSAGGGYIVVDRPSATAGQNHSFSISPQSTFNLAAHALKEVAGAANQTYVVDEFGTDSENSYNATEYILFDGNLKEYTGGTYPLIQLNGFYMNEVRFNSKSIRIQSDIYGTVVPAMTSNNTPSGYIASASSNYNSSFPAYGAFDRTQARQWASSTSDAIPWIVIELPQSVVIDQYVMTKYNSTMTAAPISWDFQGSNNGTDWITLDTVTDNGNTPASDKIKKTFDNDVAYSKYRFVFNKKYEQYVQLREIELLPKSARFLIVDGDKKYTIEDSEFIELSGELTSELINSRGVFDTGDIEITPGFSSTITVVSSHQTDMLLEYFPYPQIAVQKSLLSTASWGQINSATLTAAQTNNGFVRVAVTRDLVNWHVWRGGAWIDVGALSADAASAAKLIADGMTPSDLNGINAAGWAQLFASNSGVPDSLAFAFALNISDPATDVATIDRLTLNVNESSRWMLQTASQVEISWRADSVTFRTVTAGNYKLAYQIP